MYCVIRAFRGSVRMRTKSLARQGVQLDPDREPTLELRDQVGRLGHVEGAGRDEQDVVGPDHAVLGGDGRPLDDGQQVALDALAARRPGRAPPSRPATLSSSSRKTIPEFSTRRMAWLTASSWSTSFWASSWASSRRASATRTAGDAWSAPASVFESMSLRLMPDLLHALAGEDLEHRHRLLLHLELDRAGRPAARPGAGRGACRGSPPARPPASPPPGCSPRTAPPRAAAAAGRGGAPRPSCSARSRTAAPSSPP